ncbi:MAG: methyl-accepting chemotaxis protein, partial [Sphingobium sp.]
MTGIQFAWGLTGVSGALVAAQGHGPLGIGLAIFAFAGSTLSTIIAGRLICIPYVNTVVRMEALAEGDLTSSIQHMDHSDCVGRMTTAMQVFRDNARRVLAHSGEADMVVRRLGAGLEAVAAGDLTYQISEP